MIKTYTTDDSILKIKHWEYGDEIITVLDDYDSIREPSHVVEHNGELIWIPTFKRKVDGEDEFSLHRFVCSDPINNLEKWDYKGKLRLIGGDGEREGEDVTFIIEPDGKIYMLCEDKSSEKPPNSRFIINQYIAENWDSDFLLQAGSTGIVPFGEKAKDAVYSPFYIGDRFDPIIIDGKTGIFEENIFCADPVDGNGNYVPNHEPIFTVDDIDQPSENTGIVLTTGIGDALYKIKSNGKDKYIMKIVAYKDWNREIWESGENVYNGYWCSGLIVSDQMLSGWKVLNSELKDQHGNHTQTNIFHTDKYGWMALGMYTGNGKQVFLAKAIIDGEIPPPPNNGGNMLNLKATIETDGRVLLSYNHPDGTHNIHFDRKDENGNAQYMDTRDFLPKNGDEKGELRFENIWNATEFRAKPDPGKWEDWVSLDGGTVPVIKGCTDPNATNYNPDATEDDGSCEYAPNPDFDKEKVLNAVDNVRIQMNIIESEVNKT